ncbi:hypothetical protein ONS96_010564 [Cadophora gregata f. sp. sojae]|nr:hypothetical protein ONS96_010564 [Cadophora gregata f. sp. sojae]
MIDLKTWLWFTLIFSISIPSGGITTFGPLIISSFGFDKSKTILLNMPFGAVQIIATMGGACNRGPLLVRYYLISFYPGISLLIYSWSSQNTAGETKKKITIAMLFIGQSAGNIQKPLYRRGLISNLVLFVPLVILVILTTLYLMFLNKKHATRRVQLAKSAVIADRSMMTTEERVVSDAVDEANGVESSEKAFDEETDPKNKDFTFVY